MMAATTEAEGIVLDVLARRPIVYGTAGAREPILRRLRKKGLVALDYDKRGELVWQLPGEQP